MIAWQHKVQYYETDRMGITHHSNYIRWMEEGRVAFLDAIGWTYARMEDKGITSPIVSVQCDYKNPTTFDDEVSIEVYVKACSGAKLVVGYRMVNEETGILAATGESSHCFLDANGKILRLKQALPEFYEKLCEEQAK